MDPEQVPRCLTVGKHLQVPTYRRGLTGEENFDNGEIISFARGLNAT
jgi:hypothetical protein